MGTFFAPLVAAEGMVSKDIVNMVAARAEGVSGGKTGSRSLRRMHRRKDSGVSRFLMGHRDMAIRGYDVVGERMLGRRWQWSGSCAKMWL